MKQVIDDRKPEEKIIYRQIMEIRLCHEKELKPLYDRLIHLQNIKMPSWFITKEDAEKAGLL